MDTIQKKILTMLINENTFITSKKIAVDLNVSSKTIRRHLSILNSILNKNGAHIDIIPSKGNILIISNQNLFNDFLNKEINNLSTPTSKEERIQYIINHLIKSTQFINIDDLADEIFISTVQLRNDLRTIKLYLISYHLTLKAKYGYGLYIEGKESNIRLFINEYFFNNPQVYQQLDDNNYRDEIKNILIETLHQENILISDNALKNLCITLFVSILRSINGHDIELDKKTIESIKRKHEYNIATYIYKKIQKKFDLQISENEINYYAILLAGDCYYDLRIPNAHHNQEIDEVNLYLNLLLKKIYDHFKIDFFTDKELKNNLSLHILPFLNRIKNNIPIKNPLLKQIKEENSFAYEIALVGGTALSQHLKKPVSEDEISYFALYFILALEKKSNENIELNLLIICNTGKATAQLLDYQIRQRYHQIKYIKIINVHELNSIDIDSFDCILTTVSLPEVYHLPTLHIHNLLNDTDYKNINQFIFSLQKKTNINRLFNKDYFFMNIKTQSMEETVQYICNASLKNKSIANKMIISILEREALATTELNNFIAIPHPLEPITDFTFISVGILEKPIIWKKRSVQLILLISISENDYINFDHFYSSLYNLTIDSDTKNLIKKKSCYQDFLNLFQ